MNRLYALNSSRTQSEYERCLSLLSDLTVQLDATSDTNGTLTYLFQNQVVVTIGYSESSDSFELDLGGFKTLLDAQAALDPDNTGESQTPDTLLGALQLSATTSNDTEGQEAGSVSVDITQTVSIADTNGKGDLSVGVGTLFSMAVDRGSNEGTIELDIGSVQGSLSSVEETKSLDFKGLTAIINLNSTSEALKVSNLSVGNGPIIVAVDSEKVLDLSLDTFGFSVNSSNGEVTIDGDLNLSVFVNELVGEDVSLGTDISTLATIVELTAPSGTKLREFNSGSFLVSNGGPVGYTITEPDDSGTVQTNSVTVNSGQYLGEVQQGSDVVPAIVACE